MVTSDLPGSAPAWANGADGGGSGVAASAIPAAIPATGIPASNATPTPAMMCFV